MDSECPDAICTENDGKCVDRQDVLFVASNGADDTCDYNKPCKTLQYAMGKANNARYVIHIATPDLPLGAADVTFMGKLVIDGSQTTLAPAVGKALRFASGADIVMTAVQLDAESTDTVVVASAAKLGLFYSTVEVATTQSIDITGGSFACTNCTLTGIGSQSELACSAGGYVGLNNSTVNKVTTITSGCNVDVAFSRLDECISCIHVASGLLRVHDNLVVAREPEADAIQISGLSPGSVFAFNTVVNTNATISDGSALVCDDSVDANSNVFAYNSTTPHGPGGTCAPTSSLYDAATPTAAIGASDRRQDRSSIFTSLAGEDYHLGSASLAIGLGEPNANETTDLDGHVRPATPSAGCFEPK